MKRYLILVMLPFALVACGKGSKNTGSTPVSGPIAFEPVLQASLGFFSLAEHGGVVHAGEYGPPNPRVMRVGGGGYSLPVGESVFDLFSDGDGLYAATESSGRIALDHRLVFDANRVGIPGSWNNAYAIAPWAGGFITGFNEYPHDTRTMIVVGRGNSWTPHVVDGYHHFRSFYAVGSTVVATAMRGGTGVVLRSNDAINWEEVGQVGPYPRGGHGFFGDEDGNAYRVSGSGFRPIGQIEGQATWVCQHGSQLFVTMSNGWHGEGKSSLWSVGSGKAAKVAEFDEAEAWSCLSSGGKLYVATRSDRGGRVYRQL